MEEEKKEEPGYFSRLARAVVKNKAEQGHPIYSALQDIHYPEDAKARNDREAQKQRMADLNEESMRLSNQQRQLQIRGMELANLNAEKEMKRKDELFPSQKAQSDAAQQAAIAKMHATWDAVGAKEAENFTNALKQQYGYDNLNIYGQSIFDNSSNLAALTEATQILKAYSRSDEEGDYMLSKSGWKRQTNADGQNVLISPDGKMQFDASDEGMRKVMTDIQNNLKNDIAASYIMGGDATSIEQYATKTILQQPGIDKIFGSYGNTVGQYNDFLNGAVSAGNGKSVPRFSKEQKLHHLLSRGLQGAIVDGKISQQEMQYLTPLFDSMVKKVGGEVIFGNDVATTKVRFGSYEMPLAAYAQKLAEEDTVMSKWNNLVTARQVEMAKAMQKKAAEAEEEVNPLPDTYKRKNAEAYTDLTSEQQLALGNSFNKFELENKFLFDKLPKDLTPADLPVLRLIDKSWKKNLEADDLDADKFVSPVQETIWQLEIEELHKKALALRADNNKILKKQGYKLSPAKYSMPDKIGKPTEQPMYIPEGGVEYDNNLKKIRELEEKIAEIRKKLNGSK